MAEIWYYTKLREYERELKRKGKTIEEQTKAIEELEAKLKAERERRKKAEEDLKNFALRKQAKKPKFSDYSLTRQERLLNKGSAFKSPGRRTKAEKLREVTQEEHIYPEGVPAGQCILVYRRIVTHIQEGKKEVVLYHIYRKKWGKEQGKLPHVMPKGEYGVEVGVILAFLIYTIGVSHAQAKQILSFFCDVELGDSQINTLLDQVSKLWKKDFDRLCNLMLLALVVHVDETGWKEGKKRCYTWLFKSISHTVLLYGQRRNEEVLDKILPRETFKGIGITDCYKIYENYFPKAQKCWAHFLRKIIKLMLLHPGKQHYRRFFESLYRIFSKAKELKQDSKLTHKQKKQKVEDLKQKIHTLCTEKDTKMSKDTLKDTREFVNLQKNLMRNNNDLFTFVLHKEVEPTNNRAEQALRFTAKARNNYQTSKTAKGSKRRSIIASVLASLKQNLPTFSLKTVTEEIIKRQQEGKSLFQIQLQKLQPQAASP
jgi:transposase